MGMTTGWRVMKSSNLVTSRQIWVSYERYIEGREEEAWKKQNKHYLALTLTLDKQYKVDRLRNEMKGFSVVVVYHLDLLGESEGRTHIDDVRQDQRRSDY